ncbi:MAG: hypothetical protein GXP50_06410 [Deltaproteobacteria bacterium]|nr:hypothetical protein [Deltaproteobacteria bacterium]
MGGLRFFVLGELRVERVPGGQAVSLPTSAAAVLAYLLCAGRRVPRDTLAGTLWAGLPDARARRCLSTALWRLSGALGGGECLVANRAEVAIDLHGHWFDLAEFLRLTEPTATQPFHSLSFDQATWAEAGLALHTGDLLAGWDAPWVDLERESVRRRRHATLEALTRFYAYYGMYERALAAALRLLDEDPLREDVHRHVMQIHLEAGRRGLALRQFERCRAALRDQLDATPDPETLRLAEQARLLAPSRPPVGSPDPRLASALDRLERCIDRLERLLK